MNSERRTVVQEIIDQPVQIDERLRKIWVEEEVNYEARTPAFKETEQGITSKEALDAFDEALTAIDEGCEKLRGILAQSSFRKMASDYVCAACGTRGADVRPDFDWDKPSAARVGYRGSFILGSSRFNPLP